MSSLSENLVYSLSNQNSPESPVPLSSSHQFPCLDFPEKYIFYFKQHKRRRTKWMKKILTLSVYLPRSENLLFMISCLVSLLVFLSVHWENQFIEQFGKAEDPHTQKVYSWVYTLGRHWYMCIRPVQHHHHLLCFKWGKWWAWLIGRNRVWYLDPPLDLGELSWNWEFDLSYLSRLWLYTDNNLMPSSFFGYLYDTTKFDLYFPIFLIKKKKAFLKHFPILASQIFYGIVHLHSPVPWSLFPLLFIYFLIILFWFLFSSFSSSGHALRFKSLSSVFHSILCLRYLI